MHRCSKVAIATALAGLALPVAAQAATKSVDMGTPPKAQKTLGDKLQSDADAFFPSTISIHVGDKVRFVPAGFHTVDIVAKGRKPTPLFSPTGQKSAETDAAGNPFWFVGAGLDQLGYTPSLFKGLYGKSATFNNTKSVESGIPVANKPKPFTVTFRKAGTFTYLCDVHPGMKGVVRVLPKSRRIPTVKDDQKAVARQVAAAIKTATALGSTTAPVNTVSVGAAGAGGVERLAFFPASLTVSPGTTVTFSMPKRTRELHTATTGPGDPEKEPTSYLGTLAATLQSPTLAGNLLYASDPPGAPASLTPTSHGNGFWNSGVMDQVSRSPLPASSAVTFSAPGTYQFYCLIHPFMHATVTVQ